MLRSSMLTVHVVVSVVVFLFVSRASAQDEEFHDLGVTVTGQPSPGYYLLGEACRDSFAVLDHSGRFVYRKPLEQRANLSAYKNKWITYFKTDNGETMYMRRNADLVFLDTLGSSSAYVSDFHELQIVTDSSYYVLGRELLTLDLSSIVDGGKRDVQVVSAVIEERTFSGNTLFTWRSIDHIPVTDASDMIDLTASAIDYIHVNSISLASDGNIIISCRHLSEVIKINRATGEIMWRLGGSDSKNNQFTFLNDTNGGYTGFSCQHSAAETSDGTLLLYDNGNTKPNAASRAVEYQLNVNAMTAQRVWQYAPTPAMFTDNMGNVQELENGNVLIGYGSGTTNVVAQEVSRDDGAVQATIYNNEAAGFAPYRVLKCELYMTGSFKRITAPGTFVFAKGDSTTFLSATVQRVDAPTSVAVERHSYVPHAITQSDGIACGVIPMRWVVRFKHLNRVGGTLAFDLGAISSIDYPNLIKVYHRAVEGIGAFTLVNGTYSATTKKLTLPELLNGEFIIGYADCFPPQLISPVDGSVELDTVAKLVWTTAVGSGEYQVEVSTDDAFSTVHSRAYVTRLDTTISSLNRSTTYYWRVRSKTKTSHGPWSVVQRFTTRLHVPSIISPKIGKDTVAVLQSTPFTWKTVPGADGYRIRIERTDVAEKVIDTVVVASSFVPQSALLQNTGYTWTVAATKGSTTGAASSPARFITAIAAPELLRPEPDALDVETVNVTFRWNAVATATKYVYTILRATDGVIIARDSTTQNTVHIPALQTAMRYEWTCYGIGRYGKGEQAQPQFFVTTSTIKLSKPHTIRPRLVNNVDTVNVEFSWSPVEGATIYDLQYSSKGSFAASDTTVYDITGTSFIAPSLHSGKIYGWRVLARAPGSVSDWSDTSKFTTKSNASVGLTPLTPVAGATDVPRSGVFEYSTSANYTLYTVYVDTTMSFSSPVAFVSSNRFCQYAGLLPSQRYFWKVRGRTASGTSVDGPPSDFLTAGAVTGVDETLPSSAFAVSLTNDQLVIDARNGAEDISFVEIYDLQGRRRLTAETGGVSEQIRIKTELNPGFFIVVLHLASSGASPMAYTVYQPYR